MARYLGAAPNGAFGGSPRRTLLSCLLLLPATALAQAALHELASTYRGGWIQDGVMFDVRAARVPGDATGDTTGATTTPDGVTIFGMNVLTPVVGDFCVELYTREGGFASAAGNRDAWTFLGSFALEGRGATTPTEIPPGAFGPVTIGTGETRAFYVTTQDENLRYTALQDGTSTGDVFANGEVHYAAPGRGTSRALDGYDEYAGDSRRGLQDDGDGVSVEILTGVAKNYPFAESWPDRVFNGALLYEVGANQDVGILSDDQLAAAQAAQRGLATCSEDALPPTPPPTQSPMSPTQSPVVPPTVSPSGGPTDGPTMEPTTLASTVRKVATTLHGGLMQSGCMFDVRIPTVEEGGPPEGLTVLAVEISTVLNNEDVCVEVYTKSGTYEGYEQDLQQNEDGTWSSPTWSILGASTIEGRGERQPTHVPIGDLDPVFLSPGERRAFYVTLTEPEMRYTEPKFQEKSGEVFSSSPLGHLEMMVGAAVAYPFEETFPDRIFNGAIVYALGDVGDSKYNELGEADRERSCPQPPTVAPTMSPTAGPSKAPTRSPSASPVTLAPVTADVNVTSGTSSTVANGGDDATNAINATDATNATDGSATGPTESANPDAVPGDGVVNETAPDAATRPTPFPTFNIATMPPTVTGLASSPTFPPFDANAPRLAGECPGSDGDEAAASATKDVEVTYEYSIVVDESADPRVLASEMENALHLSLMEDLCAPGGRRRATVNGDAGRELQTVTYRGFTSDPEDYPSGSGCGGGVAVVDGQRCYVVTGGVTAVVDSDVDEGVVRQDVGSHSEGVISDPETYEEMGIQGVAFDSDSSTGDGGDGDDTSEIEVDVTEGDDEDGTPTPDGANKEENEDAGPEGGDEDGGLSSMGKIIIGVLAGTLGLVGVALLALFLHKRKQARSNSNELFREFPDEEQYGVSPGGYDQSHVSGQSGGFEHEIGGDLYTTAPLYRSSGSAPPPPEMPPPSMSPAHALSGRTGSASSAGSSPAVILNELEEMSLISNDRSKSNFGRGAIATSRVRSGRSVGSGGSGGSSSSGKKSVEFVRAGQSFSSRQSHQPEDTVDL